MNEKAIDKKVTSIIKAAAILFLIQVVLLQWSNSEEQSRLMLAGFWQLVSATYLVPVIAFGVMLDRFIEAKRFDAKEKLMMAPWQKVLLYGGVATSVTASLIYALILFGLALLL